MSLESETKDKVGAVRSQAGDDDKAPPFYSAIWSCMRRLCCCRTAPAEANDVEPLAIERIRTWTPWHIRFWVRKFRIRGTEFDNLCGEDLVYLYTLRAEDPLCFLEELDQYCDASSVDRIKFIQALDEISALYQ